MATRTGSDLAAWREASQRVFEFAEECFDLKVTADTIAGTPPEVSMTSESLVLLDFYGASGGVGRCTRELLRAFARNGQEVWCCGLSHVIDSLKKALGEIEEVRFANLAQPWFDPRVAYLRAAARLWPKSPETSSVLVKEALRRSGKSGQTTTRCLLVNYPQVFPPPRGVSGFSVYIYDLNWLNYPENFPNPSETEAWCRGWVERSALVITSSEFTRNEVIRCYKLSPSLVVAAPLAPFREECHAVNSGDEEQTAVKVMEGRYYLYPAVWGMHKGFRTLTEALERTEKTDPVVVTCGYPLDGIENSTPSLAELRRELWPRWEKLIADGRLIVMRNLLDDQLRRLRSQCKAFVLPSEYEGFGLPLVEAVYHHRAAIATSIPAHMEILTRYPQYRLATVFEPGSAEVLARNLNQDRVDVSPEPERWKEEIDETWSWLHAVRRILTALN